MSDNQEAQSESNLPGKSGHPKHDAMTDSEIETANQRILDLLGEDSADNVDD